MNIKFSVSNKIFAQAINRLSSCTGARKVGSKIIENGVVLTLAKPVNGKKPFASVMVFDGKKQIMIPFFIEESNNEEEEVIYVNINKLLALAKAYEIFDETLIQIEVSNLLEFKCLNSNIKLELADEALVCEKITEQSVYEFIIDPDQLSELIKQGGYGYGGSHTSVTLALNEKISAMSFTDARIIENTTESFQYNKKSNVSKKIAIEGTSIFSIVKLFEDSNKKIQVSVYEKYIKFTNNLMGAIVVLNESNQALPDKFQDKITAVLNNGNATILEVETFDMKTAIDVLQIVDSEAIYLEKENDFLLLKAIKDKGDYKIPAKFSGSEMKEGIWIGAKLLKESLNHIKGKEIKITINGKNPLGIIDKNNTDLKTIIALCKNPNVEDQE